MRVQERTIAGGYPGTSRLVEREFGGQGFSVAAFEAFVRALNRALRDRGESGPE